ncbi:hypothetical protein H6P81_019465 [Aristolochia fimbriata]|uniref:Prolamin-like domain-containing protein n=1 Tax=Aristolochia fimbriata TaxID=158543 RepID=A0AAV7DTC3_ARIFI|nr:hypothetical protein H6P81_019465 [Aristolochia fimbriata]
MGRVAASTASMILVVIVALTAISASSAAAVVESTTDHLAPAVHDKKLFFPIDPHVKECWDTFTLIPGCVDEIFKSFATGTIGIGPACCKVINEVADKCFPKFAGFFNPFNPLLAPTIKAHCQKPSAPSPQSSLIV